MTQPLPEPRPKPDVFYKYCDIKLRPKTLPHASCQQAPIEDWLPKLLSGESLKFTSPREFNDPFECRTLYQIDNTPAGDTYVKEKVRKLAEQYGMSITEYEQAISSLKELQNKFANLIDLESESDVLRRTGVLCLSEVNNNILMWSHYANAHTGICIGFDTTPLSFFMGAQPISYHTEDLLPVVIRPTDPEIEVVRKSLLTKAQCWAYEKEWRIWQPTLTEDERQAYQDKHGCEDEFSQLYLAQRGPGFYPFPQAAIKEIYLGIKIDSDDKTRVLRQIQAAGLRIPVYQAALSQKTYSIEFSRI